MIRRFCCAPQPQVRVSLSPAPSGSPAIVSKTSHCDQRWNGKHQSFGSKIATTCPSSISYAVLAGRFSRATSAQRYGIPNNSGLATAMTMSIGRAQRNSKRCMGWVLTAIPRCKLEEQR